MDFLVPVAILALAVAWYVHKVGLDKAKAKLAELEAKVKAKF